MFVNLKSINVLSNYCPFYLLNKQKTIKDYKILIFNFENGKQHLVYRKVKPILPSKFQEILSNKSTYLNILLYKKSLIRQVISFIIKFLSCLQFYSCYKLGFRKTYRFFSIETVFKQKIKNRTPTLGIKRLNVNDTNPSNFQRQITHRLHDLCMEVISGIIT